MKKKIAIIVIVAVAMTCGIYFGVLNHREEQVKIVPTLEEGFGIWQSEQFIDGNPGGRNVTTLTILNGKDKDRSFWVSLEPAREDKLPEGYELFPEENFDWFTFCGWNGTHEIEEPKVTLKAGEHYHLPIEVRVPWDATFLNQPAELRVQVTEMSQSFQLTAVASRWYIVVTETPE